MRPLQQLCEELRALMPPLKGQSEYQLACYPPSSTGYRRHTDALPFDPVAFAEAEAKRAANLSKHLVSKHL